MYAILAPSLLRPGGILHDRFALFAPRYARSS